MSGHPAPTEATAQVIFGAAKMLDTALASGETETLRHAHALLGDYFHQIIAPHVVDNAVEQRIIGTLWAEIEEVIDTRTRPKKPHRK